MKKSGSLNKFYQYAFPMQATLVTCNDKSGKTNVITIAWHTPISKNPPLHGMSVAPSRYSHSLIESSKEFVINFAPIEIVEKVHFCGSKSGRNTDKIKETNFTLIPSQKIKTPAIKECYAHLECKLYSNSTIGDHGFFVGEVINVVYDECAFKDEIIDNKKIKPCYYAGSNTYTTLEDTLKKF